MLNLYHVHWEEDAISTGATMLAASLPLLQILNAPFEALVCSTLLVRMLPWQARYVHSSRSNSVKYVHSTLLKLLNCRQNQPAITDVNPGPSRRQRLAAVGLQVTGLW